MAGGKEIDLLLGIAVIGPRDGITSGLIRLWSERSLEVESDAPVPAGIDGESAMLDPPVRFTINPRALRVRIASGHPGMSPSALVPERSWQIPGALIRIAFAPGE